MSFNQDYISHPVFGQVDYFNKKNHQQPNQHTPYYSVHNHHQTDAGKQKTLDPIVTGSSVIAIKYNGGIVMGTDMLCSYGSLARFNSVQRQKQVGTHTVIGVSGELSDFQSLSNTLDDLTTDDFCIDDGSKLSSQEIWNYIARLFYNSRNKGNPLWNTVVVAGNQNGKSFLGKVDLVGTCYQDDFIATGYGAHIALPLLRKEYDDNPNGLSQDQAVKLIQDCLRVLFYRDARSSKRIQVSVVDSNGVKISDPIELDTYNWHSGEAAVRTFQQVALGK
ncbi:proteasome subunit beta type 4 [Tieghemostelium lacteum]|uniref:Proteasome subunit beta n=1 Tax=Tieghemostelium lacteum TaxID=361077 RepID=A0A152A9N4_TIELA|nr:proteasome subunit beta type 4 [Tieghemostelium lacteum]|eukprot:KYR02924.1 proteasome subunit beta type 4 [Tieghemostelium lacteum]